MIERTPDAHDSEQPWALLEERMGILGAAGRELALSSAPLNERILRMAQHALPTLGTWCILDAEDSGGILRRVGIVHVAIPAGDLAKMFIAGWLPEPSAPFGGRRAINLGRAEIVPYVSDEMIREAARSRVIEDELRSLGVASTLSLPLLAGKRALGAMTFISEVPDTYHSQDILVAEELARLAALAVENARLRRLAEESRRTTDAILVENTKLNRRLVEVNEQLLLSAVREHEEAATAKHLQEETEALFRIIFDRAAMGIAVLDLEGRVADCNPALQEMLGYTREETCGRRIADFSTGEDREREAEFFQELVSGKREVFQIERQVRRSDGSTAWTNCITSLGDIDGGPIFAISLMEDITERKRMEEELRHSQRMEAIGRLAGGIAHDFNNILMSLGGRAEIMLADMEEGDPMRVDLEEIGRGVQRAARLTRQLLAFSRKQVLQPQTVDLKHLVEEMKRMLLPLIGPIELTTALAPDVGLVRADPSQLEQIIMNLVVNARDAMTDQQGEQRLSISLRSEEVEGERATLIDGSIRPGRYTVLSVSDTGSGIPPDTLPLVMEPFFTTKELGRGTGLGLSMVYGIIKQTGGYIDVSSELGVGTTFDIYLPEVPEDRPAVHEPALPPMTTAEEAEDRAPSILVVDDEDAIRALLTRVLEQTGFRVITARSSSEALETLEGDTHPFDLVVMNVQISEVKGTELARAFRSRTPGIRTLFISGHDEECVLEPEDLGESDFLTKPFSTESLLAKVRSLLPSRQPE